MLLLLGNVNNSHPFRAEHKGLLLWTCIDLLRCREFTMLVSAMDDLIGKMAHGFTMWYSVAKGAYNPFSSTVKHNFAICRPWAGKLHTMDMASTKSA